MTREFVGASADEVAILESISTINYDLSRSLSVRKPSRAEPSESSPGPAKISVAGHLHCVHDDNEQQSVLLAKRQLRSLAALGWPGQVMLCCIQRAE